MRRLIAFPVVLVTMVALGAPATAHKQVVEDPQDTPGKLDIRRTALDHRGGGGGSSPTGVGGNVNLIFRLGTWEEFRKRHLDGGRGNIMFLIRRSPESSWLLRIRRFPDGNLKARLVMCIEAQGCDFQNDNIYPVDRPNDRAVKVKVPKSDLGGVGNVVRWIAATAFGRGCDGHCHFDRAPNQGLARHELM